MQKEEVTDEFRKIRPDVEKVNVDIVKVHAENFPCENIEVANAKVQWSQNRITPKVESWRSGNPHRGLFEPRLIEILPYREVIICSHPSEFGACGSVFDVWAPSLPSR